MVPLLYAVGLPPASQGSLGVRLRWFVPLLSTCPIALPCFCQLFPFSVCVEPGASPLNFSSPQLGPVNWRVLSHSCLLGKTTVPLGTFAPIPAVGQVELCARPHPLRRSRCLANGVLPVTSLYLARHCRRFTLLRLQPSSGWLSRRRLIQSVKTTSWRETGHV